MILTSHPQHDFEPLVDTISSDSDDIVPVISFKEIPGRSWRRLSKVVASSFNKKANAVVCTHLDHITKKNIDEQLTTVSKLFWPDSTKGTTLPCSSLMGLGARDLLDKSASEIPSFEVIWDEDYVGYAVSLLSLSHIAFSERKSSVRKSF